MTRRLGGEGGEGGWGWGYPDSRIYSHVKEGIQRGV